MTRDAIANYQARRYARAAFLLEPWFKAGLLDNGATRLMVNALLISGADPRLALVGAEQCLAQQSDAGCALNVALAYGQLQRFDLAEEMLLSLLIQVPSFAPARMEMGLLAQRQGKMELAISEFRAAVDYSEKEQKQRPLFLLVQALMAARRPHEAQQHLPLLLALSEKGDPEGLYLIAEVHLALKQDVDLLRVSEKIDALLHENRAAAFFVASHPAVLKRVAELKVKAGKK